jgi:hypothetical protein
MTGVEIAAAISVLGKALDFAFEKMADEKIIDRVTLNAKLARIRAEALANAEYDFRESRHAE